MLPERTFPCPHCYQENPLGMQQCGHCGLTMISDKAHKLQTDKVLPLVTQLDEQLLFMRAGNEAVPASAYAHQLVAQLKDFASVEGLAFLPPLIEEAETQLADFPLPTSPPDKRLLLNIAILILLALFPLGMALIGGTWDVIAILCLPVVVWGYMGIYVFMKGR